MLLLLWPCKQYAQILNVENVFNSAGQNNTQFGINSAYMFHHILDVNYDLPAQTRDLMFSHDFDVVRFPGGAIGNYYRLNGTGYGAIKSEVQNVENTVQCNGTGYYCFDKDQFAPRNFIYDFLYLLEDRFEATGEKTDILYVINLLLHFVYNYDEIDQLASIQDLSGLEAAHTAGLISDDFHERILENYTAMEMLINSPYADIKGIEMGNEFYFYQEVTTFPYPPTNSNPFFNLNSALNQIQPRIEKYKTLVAFYKRLVTPLEPAVKIGVPIGGVNHFGNMANADLLWNTAIKQWMMADLDALIPHMYIKSTGNDLDPVALGGQDDHADMIALKQEFEKSLDVKFVNSMAEIVEFFALDSDFRELWMTEFNVNKNESTTQFWDEWTNTYLHGAFMQEWMKRMASSSISNYMRYAIQHTWSGSNTAYEHCIFTNVSTDVLADRAASYANDVSDFLKSQNTKKLSGNLSHSQASYDFYADAWYDYDTAEGEDCPTERLLISYSNLRGTAVTTQLNFPNDRITINGTAYQVLSGRLKAFKGLNLASPAGRTPFNSNENIREITRVDQAVDLSTGVSLPVYSTGYLEIIISPVNNDCLPLALDDRTVVPSIGIYPNPASTSIHLDLPAGIGNQPGTFIITDAMGKQLRTERSDAAVVSVEGLAPGIYFLHFSSGGQRSAATPFAVHR